MKVIAALVLVVCSAVYWYYKNVESFLFLYILPMHLIIGAMGFVMLFGIFSDQKLIKKAIGEHLVETGLFSRIRNEFLSFMCIIFVFTISILPVSGFLDSISQDLDGNEIGIGFVRIQLLFAILFFMYFWVTQPVLNFSFQRIANKFKNEIASDAGTDAAKTRRPF